MKKKFYLLFTLLLCAVANTWADTNTTLIDGVTLPSLPSGTYTGGTTVSHNGTNTAVVVDGDGNAVMQAIAPCYGSPTADNFTWANAANGDTDNSWSTTGVTWEAPAGSVFAGSTAYTTKGNAHYVNFARRGNLQKTRTFAYRFTNCGEVSALVKSQGNTAGAGAVLAVYEVGAGDVLTAVGSKTSLANAVDVITVDGLSTSATYVAYVYGENGSNGELYEIAFLPNNTEPSIKADDATINATESGVEATTDITVKGANLTGATLTATLSPAVEGLSVSLASNTISGGALVTTATLHYTTTENAKGTTTLTLSDGTTSKNVTVSYNSSVATWTLQETSTTTTWDFSKITANSSSPLYNSEGIRLTASTTPSVNDETVYANYGDDKMTFDAAFDGTTIAFTGEYPVRKNQYCQNGTLKIKTTAPGTLVVKFSDTGSSASATAVKRYLQINGVNTEYWASRENNGAENPYAAQLNVVTDPIFVYPGEITISGSSAIIINYVTFTAVPSTNVTVSDLNYRTFASKYPLDLSSVSGLTAYKATVDGDNVSFVPVTTTVPAATGLLLKGEGIHTIPVATSEPSELADNKLVGVTKATEKAAGIFVLMNDATNGLGFYKTNNAFTVGANTAYLPADVAGARTFISVVDDESTAIENVRNESSESQSYYNLRGQRVTAPTKGVYIVNGKKILVK